MNRKVKIEKALKYLRSAVTERRPNGFSHPEAVELNTKLAVAIEATARCVRLFDEVEGKVTAIRNMRWPEEKHKENQ